MEYEGGYEDSDRNWVPFKCKGCGALVYDTTSHDEWHAKTYPQLPKTNTELMLKSAVWNDCLKDIIAVAYQNWPGITTIPLSEHVGNAVIDYLKKTL